MTKKQCGKKKMYFIFSLQYMIRNLEVGVEEETMEEDRFLTHY